MKRLLIVATFALTGSASAQSRMVDLCAWTNGYYAAYEAMSAAPTGPAMDRWLHYFTPYAYFEDPTASVSVTGHESIRKPYVDAFTGPMGTLKWTIQRCVSDTEWVAVDGLVSGSFNSRPVSARFTTWMKVHGGRIAHQIDYVDYAGLTGKDTSAYAPLRSASGSTTRDAARARSVVGEYYRRYDALPVRGDSGLRSYLALLTEDFALEDPTARLLIPSPDSMRNVFRRILASNRYGEIHWQVDRRLTDGEWVVVEGTFRGTFDGRPFGTRFTTWLQVKGEKVVRQIDYVDYQTFRRQTTPPARP